MSDAVMTHIALALSLTTIAFNAYRLGYSRGQRSARKVDLDDIHPAHPHSERLAAARRRHREREAS